MASINFPRENLHAFIKHEEEDETSINHFCTDAAADFFTVSDF